MPECAKLQRKPGRRGLLITSLKTLTGPNSCSRGSLCPCTLGTARVPASQAAEPPSHSTLTGAELPQAKMSYFYLHRVTLVVSDSLQPCRLCPASLLHQGGGSPGKNTGIVLANTGCHTLLEHYISYCPSRQLP